jgi:regulation of enolase protein 1 (concanavalin A-like superfamily)
MTRPAPLLALALAVAAGALRADDKKVLEARGWGRAVDPDDDCTFTEAKGKLTIAVPGRLHDLFPGQRDPKKRNNAPRAVQPVKGDFTAGVKVTADWKPGGPLPGANTQPYNGAGLLVWDSDTQFVRFERNVWVGRDGAAWCFTTPLQYADGRQVNADRQTKDEHFKGRSTWLRVERGGDKLVFSISHDGDKWQEVDTLRAKLPEKLSVGVEAVNSSAKEFVVEFSEFGILGGQ